MASKTSRPGWLSPGGLLRGLGSLITLGLVIYLIRQQGWDEISAAVARIEVWRFLAAILLTLISRLAVARRWYVLLRSGGVPAGWLQSLRITFAGLFANNFLPTTVGGDVARMAGALQYGYDAAVSAASLVADRLVGLTGFAFTLPIGLRLLAAANLPAGAALPLAGLAAGESWLARMAQRLRKIWQRLLKTIELWLSQPRALLTALVFTFVHMGCLFLTLHLLLDGMHDLLPFWTIAGLYSLVYIVTLVPISISGWGLQEFSISYAFSALGGVSAANSLVLALMVRTLYVLVSLPGALALSDVLPGMAKAQPLLTKLDG
ncbi:MAG: flippase-like domain-containing protein [Anaerolineales bacterium]|nr:flippase-like domain-containing protein [Anaerolineales bacterium]